MTIPVPSSRPLQIYALDPMRLDDTGSGFATPRIVLNVEYEPLEPGPIGERFQVIDYDGSRDVVYDPVDLDHPHILLNQGVTPSETDPQFHQQMVYAVASSVWTACEAALGRRIGLRHGSLKIFPHAFFGENAFYDPARGALLFGYFQADNEDPGPNLPGQFVFSCLSHDVVAHETAHAVVHRLRPGFNEATNPDVLAFHEAFADLVAIFRHFSLEQVLIDAINVNPGDITNAETISGLARQFGFATSRSEPLRDAFDSAPDATALARTTEPHARGLILVQAVFAAYRTTYLARIQDLLRVASGGSGILAQGRPHPDLVHRLASEAVATADLFFSRCVQAFTYLPPIDVTFSDFLQAIVTVDLVTSPGDDSFRTSIIEAFRRRGIYARTAGSLAGDAIALPRVSRPRRSTREPKPWEMLPPETRELVALATLDLGEYQRFDSTDYEANGRVAKKVGAWAKEHAARLGFAPVTDERKITVVGFHATIRRQINGQPWVDLVVQLVQARHDLVTPDLRGVVPKAGLTIVANAQGEIEYLIAKPLPPTAETRSPSRGRERLDGLRDMAESFDRSDSRAAYRSDSQNSSRLRVNFARLHSGVDHREEQA